MNSIDNLQLSIRDFRAIKSADISLNGITVLAGINGCGKSTVSKLVYGILKWMKNYNELVLLDFRSSFRPYQVVLESLLLTYIKDVDTFFHYYNYLRVGRWDDLNEFEEVVTAICRIIVKQRQEKLKMGKEDEDRDRRMLINTIDGDKSLSFEEAMNSLEIIIHDQISISKDHIKQRPMSILNDYLDKAFGEKISKRVTLAEYGDSIFSEKKPTVAVPHFIDQLFYIDTPFELNNDKYEFWKDLNRVLKQTDTYRYSPIASTIGDGIVKGDASYEFSDNHSGFFFKDNKGRIFNLSFAATGIKSFSIIQMLLRNGSINENTLLILDEPEAHLHPQWIIEYARVIVLIHKSIGAKFLISSHSPDMVSAIRYIAETEGCMNGLEFYTARHAQDGSGRFNFRSTGVNVEPIFKSFNRSFERLNKYVESD